MAEEQKLESAMQEARNRARALTRTLSDWLLQAKSRPPHLGWTARQVMSQAVKWVSPSATAMDAARIMWEQDCGCVPVVDSRHRLLGMLTDRDLCMAAYTQGHALTEVRVESAMSKDVATCGPHDSVEHVVGIMSSRGVRRVPVVDAEGMLIGLIAVADVARACETAGVEPSVAHEWLGRLMESLSKRREVAASATTASS